jgi:hypothetical protein
MNLFPVLKTGAVAQYPSQRASIYSTEVLRFVDGLEQRARSFGTSLRRWVIQLDLVDEGELAAIDEFFSAQDGSGGEFSFTDPWDGKVYANCSLENDELKVSLEGPSRGRTRLVVRENRT